jgi:hypothetical protein
MAETDSPQMSIQAMAEFSRTLAQTVATLPDADKLRAAMDQALTAECVQCGIVLSGSELLKIADESTDDAKVQRLRIGYCARNGCASLFYRVNCAPHPDLNWPALLQPAHELSVEEKAAAELAAKKQAAAKKRSKALFRTSVAFVILLIVFAIRQIYIGGSIPFIREPEKFRVDHEVAQP